MIRTHVSGGFLGGDYIWQQRRCQRCVKVCDEAETPTYRHGGREYDDTVLLRQQIAAAIRNGIPS